MMTVAFSKVGLTAFRPCAARNFTNVKLGFSCVPDFARRLFSTRPLRKMNLEACMSIGWLNTAVYKTPEDKEMRFQIFKDTVAYVSEKKPAAAVPQLLEHLNGYADNMDKEFELMSGAMPRIRHTQYYKR